MQKLMWLRARLSIPNLLACCGDLISRWNIKPEGKKIRGNSWVLTHGLNSAANQVWAYFPFELTVMDVSQPDHFQSPPERLKSLPYSDSSPYKKMLEVRQKHAGPYKTRPESVFVLLVSDSCSDWHEVISQILHSGEIKISLFSFGARLLCRRK